MKFLFLTLTFSILCMRCFSEEEAKERTCRIIFLQRPEYAPTEAYLYDGKVSHKVSLPSMNFSELIKLPEGDLTLGLIPNSINKAEDFPSGAPTVKIASKITDLYLILGSDLENKVFPIRMVPVDVGDDQLKPGQTLWINLTSTMIAGKLGNESLSVPPGMKVVGMPPLSASGYYQAMFLYQPNKESEFVPVMHKSWWFDATSKNLGFIINSGSRLPRIYTFRDYRPPESLMQE